ncbi:MAG TPA: hypothetical protein VIU93_08705 [Gallionellaceae bacterium]
MNATTQLQAEAMPKGNYVLLTADTLHLILPQHEVGAAGYLEGGLEASDVPGLLKLSGDDGAHRFVALSAQMTPLPHCPPERFLVASLGEEDDELSWCWNELQVLINVELPLHRLPSVLCAPDTPVDRYVEIEGKLAYLCSARQLRAFAFPPEN